ncbi:hypothetical protein BDV29DRAFT_157616 [Aspergillus leporis]|jgi:hypothetical protein|uniref:SnoaL-like domain-containing protein n=1 Tax=Aspergillus leporis TaxID=41062 RepID=A0A5N5WXZ4_9EURO|nr:hypothetical protein BDV29DRAFT_157616 [Aspergillus leporis]
MGCVSNPSLRERLIQIAQSYFTSLEQFTPEKGFPGRTPDFVAKVLPVSFGLPPRTTDELLVDHMEMVSLIKLKNYKATIMDGTEPIVDEAKRKVVMHVKVSIETAAGPYENEFIYIFTANQDATLLKEVIEFVDTAAGSQLAAQLAAGKEPARI